MLIIVRLGITITNTPFGPICKKIIKKIIVLIYKKKFSRYIYCLKDISNPHLMFVLSILVSIFNASQIFVKVYL